MAKAGRGQTRRDSKRRVLRPGESIRADGKYQYKYHIDGKPHFVYSWKLEPTDKLPKGKKPCLSLRDIPEYKFSCYSLKKDPVLHWNQSPVLPGRFPCFHFQAKQMHFCFGHYAQLQFSSSKNRLR